MTRTFIAEAVKGYIIKVIIDVLNGFLQRSVLRLTPDGIFLRATDRNHVICFKIDLLREKFLRYECKTPIDISLNFKHLQTLMKNVKKKDTIVLFIDDKNPGKLGISITQDKAKKNETNYIVFQEETDVEEMEAPGAENYYHPVVIESVDFQKVKKLSTINNRELQLQIQRSNFIRFSADAVVRSSEVSFGELTTDEEVEGSDDAEYPNLYEANFSSQTFSSLIKLPGLCTQMQFYSPNIHGMPLKIKVSAGLLGEIEIYIKDLKQINYEKRIKEQQAV